MELGPSDERLRSPKTHSCTKRPVRAPRTPTRGVSVSRCIQSGSAPNTRTVTTVTARDNLTVPHAVVHMKQLEKLMVTPRGVKVRTDVNGSATRTLHAQNVKLPRTGIYNGSDSRRRPYAPHIKRSDSGRTPVRVRDGTHTTHGKVRVHARSITFETTATRIGTTVRI